VLSGGIAGYGVEGLNVQDGLLQDGQFVGLSVVVFSLLGKETAEFLEFCVDFLSSFAFCVIVNLSNSFLLLHTDQM
jgi:hypothetical protein